VPDIRYELYPTPFGHGAVVAGREGVVEVFLPFGCDSAEAALHGVMEGYPDSLRGGEVPSLAAAELEGYFCGRVRGFSVPLDLRHLTPFQRRVCLQVNYIGYGMVSSYGEVARRVGSPGAARGVGGVMAANRLPILIPCHRVVSSCGEMVGYSGSGGIASKRVLLQLEGVSFATFSRVIFGGDIAFFSQKTLDRHGRGK